MARTIKNTRTSKDIKAMLASNILQQDTEDLLRTYHQNSYFEQSSRALKKIIKAEDKYEKILAKEPSSNFFEDWIASKVLQKSIEIFLPGTFLDNIPAKMIADLWNESKAENEKISWEINRKKAYDEFYNAVVDGIQLSQTIGSTIRNDNLYYHIGVGNSKQISVFELDLNLMHEFEKDQSIFALEKKKNKDWSFGTQVGLDDDTILSQLQAVHARKVVDKNSNLSKNIWADLRADKSIQYRSGKTVRASDKFELFESDIIDQLYYKGQGQLGNSRGYEESVSLMSNRKIFKHDSVSGYAQGDRSFIFGNDTIGYVSNSYQSKFFNTELEDKKRRFNITSLNSLKEALTLYSDEQLFKNTLKDAIKEEKEKIEKGSSETSEEFQNDIIDLDAQIEEEATNEVEDLWEQFFGE